MIQCAVPNIGPLELLSLFVLFGLVGIPAFVVGSRRRVSAPGLAFVPLVGPYIVILRSIGQSSWMCLLAVLPLVGLVFGVWLAFVVPSGHGRTKWWALPLLIPLVQFATFYVYAFTLERATQPVQST